MLNSNRRDILKSLVPAPAILGMVGRAPANASSPVVRKTVYAWYPAHMGTWETTSIDWDAITHISYRTVFMGADGSVVPHGEPSRSFLEEARRHGVKVTVLVWANNAKDSAGYLTSRPEKAVRNLLTYVREHHIDGLAYDDEQWKPETAAAMTRFLQLLSKTFKDADPNYHIALAAPPVISNKDRNAAKGLDWPAIADSVDAIIPMLYTANPPSIGWTTNAQPLAGGGSTSRTVPRDMITLMGDYYEALRGEKSKLLLGIPSFPYPGYEFRCRTAERLSPILACGERRRYEYLEAEARKYGKRWDSKQQSAWYVYEDGDHFVQGWYDDEQSWAARLDYTNQEGLAGVGMWVLDGAANSRNMWAMLRSAFAPPQNQQG